MGLFPRPCRALPPVDPHRLLWNENHPPGAHPGMRVPYMIARASIRGPSAGGPASPTGRRIAKSLGLDLTYCLSPELGTISTCLRMAAPSSSPIDAFRQIDDPR